MRRDILVGSKHASSLNTTVLNTDSLPVTREEAAWESFSEEEPAPRVKPRSQPDSRASTKAKKAASKPGQGNIMSFFGKK